MSPRPPSQSRDQFDEITFDVHALEDLPRKELQRLAKKHSIKANLKSSSIRTALRRIAEQQKQQLQLQPAAFQNSSMALACGDSAHNLPLAPVMATSLTPLRNSSPQNWLTTKSLNESTHHLHYQQQWHANQYHNQQQLHQPGLANPRGILCMVTVLAAFCAAANGLALLAPGAVAYGLRFVTQLQDEVSKWGAAENEFHGVCGTIRGRLLHPSSCALGAQESGLMAFAAVSVAVHWLPKVTVILARVIFVLLQRIWASYFFCVYSLYSADFP